jgi:carboxylesterase type B
MESILKIKSYDQIASIAKQSFPSDPEAVLLAYNLDPSSSTQDLHKSLLQFMTDAKFGLPVFLAHRNLSSSHSTPEQHPSRVQAYRIKFTNPFPGPLRFVSHHCVDMIYQFDGFHDELVGTGEGSNVELVEAMQRHWVEFIWDGCQGGTAEFGVQEDEITVYGRDRKVVVRKLGEDAECVERGRRFKVLEKDMEGMRKMWGAICGTVPLDVEEKEEMRL